MYTSGLSHTNERTSRASNINSSILVCCMHVAFFGRFDTGIGFEDPGLV